MNMRNESGYGGSDHKTLADVATDEGVGCLKHLVGFVAKNGIHLTIAGFWGAAHAKDFAEERAHLASKKIWWSDEQGNITYFSKENAQ